MLTQKYKRPVPNNYTIRHVQREESGGRSPMAAKKWGLRKEQILLGSHLLFPETIT